ncbi:MAG: peptidoglycan-binding protein LysM [Beijerinckiaceae bacterium]|jgi:nucleoid-associated protein YgaU|nr:peptidoglycan-binding protein LysM [Beijerinckiaceae bacterium]
MGLFNFIKSVGEKIFGASEAQAAPADALKAEVAKHGFDVQGLDIQVEGNTVKVSGEPTNAEIAEKIVLALGNTMGVATVEANFAALQKAMSKMYEVKKGDTLWKIAEANYGKGKGDKYPVIFEANKPMLTHPDKIYPGQILRIPPL